MSTSREAPSRTTFVLAILFAGTFVMGCAEVLVVGMLDLIATDLSVSVSATGALVTANALGIAIGGPLLTLLTTRFDRRAVLLASIAVFAAANLLPALGADYPVFIVARVAGGAVQGLFIAAAIVTATPSAPTCSPTGSLRRSERMGEVVSPTPMRAARSSSERSA